MKNDSYILFQNLEMQMQRLSSFSSFLAAMKYQDTGYPIESITFDKKSNS